MRGLNSNRQNHRWRVDLTSKIAAVFAFFGLVTMADAQLPSAQLQTQAPGARVAFITREAEAGRTNGRVVVAPPRPRGDDSSPALEASGRAFTELSRRGDFVEFPIDRSANALVLRFCIPDAPTGGGTSATLSLLVNGKFRQSLSLDSRHAYLYGEAGQNGQSNDPTQGQPHVFWDEMRCFLARGLKRGDTLRLQIGAGADAGADAGAGAGADAGAGAGAGAGAATNVADKAAFYRIDLVDLENAPAPLAPPPAGTFLSVADFGARGDDSKDDTDAIARCIEQAQATHKTVWIPAGNFLQSAQFTLDGVVVRGAGMWHTRLEGTVEGDTWAGNVGFQLNGEAPQVFDLAIDSAVHTARTSGGKAFCGSAHGFRIENVWVTHTLCGAWLGGSGGVIRGCRIRSTYADAINLNNGASDNLVENNHIRGCGDDGIAILSETEFNHPLSRGDVVRFNTVSAIWWGHNGDVAGGSGHLIEDNLFVDNAKMGCFAINQPGSFPMNPLSDTIIRHNAMVRGGGNFAWQKRGAIWIYPGSTTCRNVLFEENLVLDPIFCGIHLTGSQNQVIRFVRNLIQNPGDAAIHIDADVTGQVEFRLNTVRDLPIGATALDSQAKPDFVVIQSDNSWQK